MNADEKSSGFGSSQHHSVVDPLESVSNRQIIEEVQALHAKTHDWKTQMQSQMLQLESALEQSHMNAMELKPLVSTSTVPDSAWMGLSTLNIVCIIVVFSLLVSLTMLNYRIWRNLVDVRADTRVLILSKNS
jgi:hypothetical protein